MSPHSSGQFPAEETLPPTMLEARWKTMWIRIIALCFASAYLHHAYVDMIRPSIHKAWILDQHKLDLASSPDRLPDDDSESEAVFFKYPRKNVDKKYLNPRGKYRAVCKLFIAFDSGIIIEATGSCIKNDLIATAGHCVFDEEHGGAKAIEAHIGYHGSNPEVRKGHEVRTAVCVAVHREWYDGYKRSNDIALIRLQDPFNQMSLLKFKDCQLKAGTTVRVVGYSRDVPGGMEGQCMYESTGPADWDPEDNAMLVYRLDTAKGSSGSPVFTFGEDQEPEVVGIHVCTGKIPRTEVRADKFCGTGRLYRVNKAVAIGRMGNDLAELQRALALRMGQGKKLTKWLLVQQTWLLAILTNLPTLMLQPGPGFAWEAYLWHSLLTFRKLAL